MRERTDRRLAMSTGDPAWRRHVRTLLSYGVAVTSVLVALLITRVMELYFENFLRSSLFMSAIMFSTWCGGFMPGMVATVLSDLALDYYYMPPFYTLEFGREHLPRVVVFSLSALFISWVTAKQQHAERTVRRVRDELEVTVQERTAALRRTNEQLQADITERKRAEEALRQTQAELAHVSRVMTMGELTASIAHEVNQPLTAVINNGNASLRWLAQETPDLEEVREALRDIIRDGQRASDVIARTRALLKKAPTQAMHLDINEVIEEVVGLTHREVQRHEVRLRTELAPDLPPVLGDRVQLQQVLLNLVMNGIEAMSTVVDRPRELQIRSGRAVSDGVLVAVQDSGIGLDPQTLERIFDAFFTTKPVGMGMGLSIGRTIIKAHGGQLWAERNPGHGATFQFILPKAGENRDD